MNTVDWEVAAMRQRPGSCGGGQPSEAGGSDCACLSLSASHCLRGSASRRAWSNYCSCTADGVHARQFQMRKRVDKSSDDGTELGRLNCSGICDDGGRDRWIAVMSTGLAP